MKKRNHIVLLMFLVFASSGIFYITTVTAEPAKIYDYEAIDIGPDLRTQDLSVGSENLLKDSVPDASPAEGLSEGAESLLALGETKYWLTLNEYASWYVPELFELRAISDNTEIWVQVDLSYPVGDPRDIPIVSDENVDYLLDEFDSNINPVETEYFGKADDWSGDYPGLWDLDEHYFGWGLGLSPDDEYHHSEENRTVILVSNVKDEAYYNPDYPYYIAGFYSPTFEYWLERNIITMDSHDWENRIGDDAARPNLYEGLISHEYQHLIHDDYNPDDEIFMNEGCSMYAESLCGYPVAWGDIESFLATPDNSLTEWEDQGGINILADYGSSLLWTIYLSDHYGGAEFISHFVQAGIPGVEGINAALLEFGYDMTFDDVYHDWRIANLIHTNMWCSDKYNYVSIDLNDAEVSISPYELSGNVPWTTGTSFGTTVTILGYDTGVSRLSSYGTDYIKIDGWNKRKLRYLKFDGDDLADYGWTLTDLGWFSGGGILVDKLLVGEAYIDPADPVLELNTYWDIEDYWDFGFVQVSTDDGETWTSLENVYTTDIYDANAHPDIIANLPGLTGWSGDFIDISFDLSAYAGETVLLGFRYMTDWGTEYEGWYINSASVSGTSIELEKVLPEADFMVTVIEVRNTRWGVWYRIDDMEIDDEDETGCDLNYLKDPDYLIVVVSSISDLGTVDYRLKTKKFRWCHRWYF
ncbi:MAG: hypothetical protein GY870_14545 [archaeon]|nr:hypothetical protein [archaeon]